MYQLQEISEFKGRREYTDVQEALELWVNVPDKDIHAIMRGKLFSVEDREMYWLQGELAELGLVAIKQEEHD